MMTIKNLHFATHFLHTGFWDALSRLLFAKEDDAIWGKMWCNY